MRCHHDQIAFKFLCCIDDSAGCPSIWYMKYISFEPRLIGESLYWREDLVCQFLLAGIVALEIHRRCDPTSCGRDRGDRHRVGRSNDGDLAAKSLCQRQAMIDTRLCEFGTVG